MKGKYYIFYFILLFLLSCENKEEALPSLNNTYEHYFHMGVAINPLIYSKNRRPLVNLVKNQYSLVVAENSLKWELIHPKKIKYNFKHADNFVEFGITNNKKLHGHVLVWHSQTPEWVFENDNGEAVSRDSLLNRMRDHIRTVTERYKRKIASWDVVNEAFEDNGQMRQSKWLQIIGKDYLEAAFSYAHQTVPDAKLVYNDYNLYKKGKRESVVKMLQDFHAKQIPIDIIGMQGHWQLDFPSIDAIEKSIVAFHKAGAKIMITELDIDVLPAAWKHQGADISRNYELKEELNPYPKQLPDSVQNQLAQRYADLFKLFKKHSDKIFSVTFWGTTDKYSWLNNWPVHGRTSYPLLFDRNAEPKKAFYKVIEVGKKSPM